MMVALHSSPSDYLRTDEYVSMYAEHIPRFSNFQNIVNIGGMVGGPNK